jgi:hypothetical protein
MVRLTDMLDQKQNAEIQYALAHMLYYLVWNQLNNSR